MKKFILLSFLLLFPLVIFAQDYSTPDSTFDIFKECAKNGDIQGYIKCTTKESQMMLSQRKPSLTQLRNEYNDLADKKYRVERKGNLVTLYLIPKDPHNPPYFLRKESGQWKLDLKAMSEKIYFDHENKWHWK